MWIFLPMACDLSMSMIMRWKVSKWMANEQWMKKEQTHVWVSDYNTT